MTTSPPQRQSPSQQFVQRFFLSRWLDARGIDLERQMWFVQWALPLLLSCIVFVDEFHEHILERKEPFLTASMLEEILFFGILGPAAIWLVLLWVRGEWRQRERDKETLQRTYDELAAAQERLRVLHEQRGELLNRMLVIQEEERRRMAREIHDELGQLLTGLSLNLRVCRDAVPDNLPRVQEQLSRIGQLVQQTIDQAHRIIVDLRPTSLDDYGLEPALREELHKRLDPSGISVEMDVQGDVDKLDADSATTAFHITQEAVTNVLRHAHAQNIRVRLQREASAFVVVVEDDGVGPPPRAVQGDGGQADGYVGVGILGMQERAAALGGRVTVSRRTPTGTMVHVWLPVHSPAAEMTSDVPNGATAHRAGRKGEHAQNVDSGRSIVWQ